MSIWVPFKRFLQRILNNVFWSGANHKENQAFLETKAQQRSDRHILAFVCNFNNNFFSSNGFAQSPQGSYKMFSFMSQLTNELKMLTYANPLKVTRTTKGRISLIHNVFGIINLLSFNVEPVHVNLNLHHCRHYHAYCQNALHLSLVQVRYIK